MRLSVYGAAACLPPLSRQLRTPPHLSTNPYDEIGMADTMDVDPPTAAPSEPKGKTKEDGKIDKKRFEVKKVRPRAY